MPADKKSYRTRTNKYKADPFRPQPRLRENPKSRRHHPVAQKAQFCTRMYTRNKKNRLVLRCKNHKQCAECFPLYKLFEEK